MQTTQIAIGTEANQYLTQRVLEYSIRLHANGPLDIRIAMQTEARVGGTNFGFVRFKVPCIFNYQGRAIYQDADQLAFADEAELLKLLDDQHTFALVNRPKGYFGGKPVPVHNQTSVMVMNCEKLKAWDPKVMFNHVVPNKTHLKEGQIEYRDFMTLKWVDQNEIQPIDPSWNHFNIVEPDTKIVHYSHVRSQPWKNPKHPLSEQWGDWLKRSILDGFVGRTEVVREVWRGHVGKHVLKFIPWFSRPFKSEGFPRAAHAPV